MTVGQKFPFRSVDIRFLNVTNILLGNTAKQHLWAQVNLLVLMSIGNCAESINSDKTDMEMECIFNWLGSKTRGLRL
jgi:hypothetical protein